MSAKIQGKQVKSSKKIGAKGVAFIGLCVVACKAPLLFVLLGFGGAGATASLLDVPPIVQTIGIAVAFISVASVVTYIGYRIYVRSNS